MIQVNDSSKQLQAYFKPDNPSLVTKNCCTNKLLAFQLTWNFVSYIDDSDTISYFKRPSNSYIASYYTSLRNFIGKMGLEMIERNNELITFFCLKIKATGEYRVFRQEALFKMVLDTVTN